MTSESLSPAHFQGERNWPPPVEGGGDCQRISGIFYFIFFKVFLKNLFKIFFFFWLCWVFVAVWAFSSCSERGLLFVAVRGLLIAVASLVMEHGL